MDYYAFLFSLLKKCWTTTATWLYTF